MAGAMLAASQDMLKTDSVMVIVMTTSSFTPEALGYAKTNEDRMQLIDGQQLVSMMQRVQPQ
jgi:restriction endonuclease Mrr